MKREQIEKLIFGEGAVRRFTQDSPILPDVWIRYGEKPAERMDLLLNPYLDVQPGRFALALRERLKAERDTEKWQKAHPNEPKSIKSARIAYNQATVVACLTFHEVIRVVLPMTYWWDKNVASEGKEARLKKIVTGQKAAVRDLQTLKESADSGDLKNHPLLLWMAKVVGRVGYEHEKGRGEHDAAGPPDDQMCIAIFSDWMKGIIPATGEQRRSVWSVTRNRPAEPTMWRSTLAVKADAARSLFNIDCSGLTWAILDSGIDATHPAFAVRTSKGKLPSRWREWDFKAAHGDWSKRSRVTATYNFAAIRDHLTLVDEEEGQAETTGDETATTSNGAAPTPAAAKPFGITDEQKMALRDAILNGRAVDWEVLAPFLKIEHDSGYVRPLHEHGTHVAGILAGHWLKDESKGRVEEEEDMIGVCPDIKLYDLRVLDSRTGEGDEFSVMAALQFIRHLNSHREHTSVHGVNMSLSIKHDVSNYACGCTPVCEECARVVNSGTVVVAAAGNLGYLQYMTPEGPSEGYRSISVTDPGNAEDVITVGATHAHRPHTYGVSYFSSRGPTGDGRIKPDIVAPGERITSAVPERKTGVKDGTSMAAPHVSGAAALLMARHRELVGKPRRVKEILCRTATDLGRERYFQGCGMVDVLRALQSV